jgi:hypothetical protein
MIVRTPKLANAVIRLKAQRPKMGAAIMLCLRPQKRQASSAGPACLCRPPSRIDG